MARSDEEALEQIRRQQEEQRRELAELREQLRRDQPPTNADTTKKLERGLADLPTPWGGAPGPGGAQGGDDGGA